MLLRVDVDAVLHLEDQGSLGDLTGGGPGHTGASESVYAEVGGGEGGELRSVFVQRR